eukprot:CAMPEP_0171156636 /NCGR_PEP_ID=MMETSP0790-20130122/1546_1 /TAXON_ID=2925 /ORGANISM="Alexandrium catenella, Strain OF101" /LENGTH=73 /DNA_ID=CAMNT_0011620949 /DNA_START=69 /DNA_END=287 /DNA_ORIENTATION=-
MRLAVLFLALTGASASLRLTHAASKAAAAGHVSLAISEAGAPSELGQPADNNSHSNATQAASSRYHLSAVEGL